LVAFCKHVGVAKFNSTHEFELLEFFVRSHLNKTSARRMVVLDPVRLVIENWPAGTAGKPHVEWVQAQNNPEDPAAGAREVPFCGELWIEREDFMEEPPKDFFRLSPGREVRLRYGYFVTCIALEKDQTGRVATVRCTYDPKTRGGNAPDGRKVKATIHWVSAPHALDAEVRLFEHLFTDPNPAAADGGDFIRLLHPNSRKVVRGKCEPSLASAKGGERFQFERLAYFSVDPKDSRPGAPVFNRTVTLKDTWQKMQKKDGPQPAGKKT
ncbi:MAG TPA: glutamine--tRNA ligase, partial [Planctomycetota bacterium]|nr:glutamine--tRNA ligase [Planctomycetota bacterium]